MLLSPSRKKPSIGLTPLIDVVFILLIFFMLVMQFQQFQQNPINLQKQTERGANVVESESITVLDNNTCEWQLAHQSCKDVLNHLLQRQPERVMVGYAPSATLQQVMHWHDKFITAGLTVSLAVPVKNENGGSEVSKGGLQ